MYGIVFLLIFLFITSRRYKSAVNKKKKQVSLYSLAIMPIAILYVCFLELQNSKTPFTYSFTMLISLFIALIIGIILGYIRARFSNLELDINTGNIYSQYSIIELSIFIGLLILKIILSTIFGFASHGLFIIVNDSLIVLTVSTILSKRVVMIIQYFLLLSKYKLTK